MLKYAGLIRQKTHLQNIINLPSCMKNEMKTKVLFSFFFPGIFLWYNHMKHGHFTRKHLILTEKGINHVSITMTQ